MITTQQEFSFEYFANNYSVSVHKEFAMHEDGNVIGRQRVESKAFLPGTIDDLADYLGDENHPLVSFCNMIWTPEIIAMQEQINQDNLTNTI